MTANRFRAWFTLSLTLTVMGWAMLGAAPAARGAEPAGIPGVSITKRADRVSVHRGEVLTYTVEVINGSGRDLRWGGGQGLVFEDAPPAGFSYVPRSGRITLPDGTSHPTLAPGARRGRLIFGLADAAGTLSGPDLAAGARIALTYQLAVGPEATVDRAVDNRVFARTLAGAAVTPEARARVRVEADAELDEALVLGVVFCDADEDGVQDPGEGGAGGVKIYGDHGWDVDTDAQGRWHLKGFRAGNHLVKVDEATLPPGGHLTTPPRHLLYLTPGLVTRTSFGTTCPGAAQRPGAPTRQAPAPAALPRDGQPAPARPTDAVVPPTGPLPVVTVAGDLAAGVVSVDGRPLPPMAATLTLQPAVRPLEPAVRPGVRNIAWSPAGLTDPAVFATKVVGRLTPATRWRLILYRVSGSARVLVREMFGKGAPPASITWNGTDPSGAVSLVERGGLYHAVLSVTDGRGGSVQSAPAVFGVSYGAPERPLARRVIRGAKLFRAGMRPGPGLARALKQLKTLVRHNPGAKLIIDVHEGGAGLPEDELTRSRRGAFLLGELATKLLGLRPRAIAATGYGGTRPLRPVAGPRDADFNRRVELALYPAESPRLFKAPPKVERAPEVWVQGRRLTVDASGAFAGAVPRPREEALGITLRTRDGGQRSLLVATDAAPTAAPAPPPAVPAPVPAAAGSPPTPGTTAKAAANATAKAATGAAEAPQGPGPVGLNIGPTPRLTLVRVGAGGDEHKGPGAGDEAGAQGWTPAADDPLRRFGGRALREAIGAKSILLGPAPPRGRRAGEATAAELSVSLPPHGVKISTTRLWVAGTTNPKNKIQANGRSLHVNRDGSFGGLVPLPVGKSDLVVTSTDEAGYVARLAWPVEVTKSELFLMALADGALGHVGANLDERATTDTYRTGDIFLAGRGALTLKARVSGTELAKNLFITAHLDTAQREAFSAFYDQVIDPARDYAVFGDAAQDGVHAKMRGPLYVLVQADKSKLEVGNVHTDLQGVELFRYDRAFYGAQLDFNKAFAKGWDTRVQGFVTDDVKRLSRGHDELRATGGSLYYLSRRDVAEGSEKLSLVVREVSTGLELARRPLVRDRDYRVDYVDGRVSMKTPLPSTVDAMWSVGGLQPFRERELLDGHEVWLVADYEARGTTTGGDLAWGVHGSQRIAGVVEVGGGYVREGRADGGDDYQLLGAHVKVDLAKRTHAVFEYAESLRPDGVSRLSDDGGLRFRTLDRSGSNDHGIALKVGLSSHLGELFHVADDLDLTLKGYYQVAEPGFHAVGTLQDQGMERFGGQAVYNPTHKDRVALRADGALVLQPDERFSTGFRGLTRTRFAGQYVHTEERWSVSGEALFGQHRDDLDGVVHDTGVVALGGRYKLTRKLALELSQEADVAGDDAMVGPDFTDRMVTNLGLRYELSEDLALGVGQVIRWNGDNATRLGLRTRLSDTASVYAEERLQPDDETGRLVGATVLGAEQALGDGGRAYGEYRLQGGVSGPTNRAVVGLGKRFKLAPGVAVSAAYERSQTFGGYEAIGARDVVSAGLEALASDIAKFGGRYELRWDRGDTAAEGVDRMQVVLRNGLDVKLGEAWTGLAMVNYTLTQNLSTRQVDREGLEATGGLVWRPQQARWLTLLLRYTRRVERRTTAALVAGATAGSLGGLGGAPSPGDVGGLGGLGSLAGAQRSRSVIDLASVAGIFELPWRLQLSEKLAYKHATTRVDGLTAGDSDLFLWVNRLGFHLVENFDLAVEYRLLWSLVPGGYAQLEHGALAEVAYAIAGYARVGVGYRWSRFSDDLLADPSRDQSGFFVRLSGMY